MSIYDNYIDKLVKTGGIGYDVIEDVEFEIIRRAKSDSDGSKEKYYELLDKYAEEHERMWKYDWRNRYWVRK